MKILIGTDEAMQLFYPASQQNDCGKSAMHIAIEMALPCKKLLRQRLTAAGTRHPATE